jgi:hypothetical protein
VIDDDAAPASGFEPDDDLEPIHRSNRGFWIVAVALGLTCVMLVLAIFANRPLKDSIAHTEFDLKGALAKADSIHAETGTFAGADAAGLTAADDTRTYLPGDQPSTGPGSVSVQASAAVWAAAVQARPQACFYIRQEAGVDTTYGVGTVCTGQAALAASDTQW